jgi:hypothetical protein
MGGVAVAMGGVAVAKGGVADGFTKVIARPTSSNAHRGQGRGNLVRLEPPEQAGEEVGDEVVGNLPEILGGVDAADEAVVAEVQEHAADDTGAETGARARSTTVRGWVVSTRLIRGRRMAGA